MPSEVVAFAYRDGWMQIPVQVDERDTRLFSAIYGSAATRNRNAASFGQQTSGEAYCDPLTFTGADSDPTIDANDEIVFMASDAGVRVTDSRAPAGARAGTGLEVEILDPLTGDASYAYLFLQDGVLDPSAGVRYVEYTFETLSGDYVKTYNTAGNDPTTGLTNSDHGPQLNPEDSTIRTSVYERHWSYRWTCDRLSLFGGDSLVEREDYWIQPGSCGRHVGTFNAQEGCFVANISGPVRAIRSYMGANSGPLIQVDRIYYEAREEIALHFRVHPRPSVGTFYVDHTEAALGMTYSNDLNPAGVTIDGTPDRLILGRVRWEMISGEQGSIVRLHDLETNIPFTEDEFTLFYADDLDTTTQLCEACTIDCEETVPIGDEHLIGASGPWITGLLPNTDPRLPDPQQLTILVANHYGTPNAETAWAETLRSWQDTSLRTSVRNWEGG